MDTPFLSPEERLLREKFPSEEERAAAAARLERGEPLAYVLGEWYFYNEVYTVTPAVLIPRADTEILVEQAIRTIPRGARFLDLCTGSGCIAISILANRPDLTAVAADLSETALAVARENAVRNRVADRITFVREDVTKPAAIMGTFAAVLSNPPYIDTDVVDTLSAQVRHEPRMALDGGKDGMDFYRAILRNYADKLENDGIFLLEIGYDQREKITALASGAYECRILRDYGGNDRVALLRAKR